MPYICRCFILLILVSVFSTLIACSHPVKEKSAVEAAAPAGSLYARLGGQEVVESFADQFVRQIALNNKIMSNPIVAGALSKNQTAHKKKLATLICQITGGPCKYEGRKMREAHAPLKITQDEWKEMTRVFIRVLQQLSVPKKERQELARLVAKYKTQIVGT